MREEIQQPLNAQERYLYGINKRLEILIEQLGSLLEHIAKKEQVAVTNHVDKEETKVEAKKEKVEIKDAKPVKRTRTRKKE